MRFCMVTTFYPPYNFGGDGIFVRELALALVGIGHEVRVIHCEDAYKLRMKVPDQGLPLQYDDNGIDVCRLKNPLGIISPLLTQQIGQPVLKTKQLDKLLNDNFDVINFHNISLIGGSGVLALGKAPVKLFTLHEHWLICATHVFWKNRKKRCDSRQCISCCIRSGIPPQLWRYTGQIQRALREIDTLIAPSHFTAEQHLKLYPDVPIHVVPLFSRLQSLPDSQPRQHTNTRSAFVYTGRITDSKGVDSLLQTFTELPEYDLILAGTGDALEQLQIRYWRYSNISFVKQLEEDALVTLYGRALALIIPSLAPETFGLSAVEAMACGTPAIVRDAGGCAEIIKQTGAGFVYRDSNDLPALLHRLANDRELQNQMRGLAMSGYQKHYTRQRYITDYMGLISEIQKHKSPDYSRGADADEKHENGDPVSTHETMH